VVFIVRELCTQRTCSQEWFLLFSVANSKQACDRVDARENCGLAVHKKVDSDNRC